MILAMSDIKALVELDFKTVFLGVFVLLFAFKGAIILKDWFCERFGIETKKMRERREDHELIRANAEAIKELAEIHKHDNEISNEHDDKLREDFTEFMGEMKYKIEQIAYDRINDREKSREIRADLAGSIKIIAEDNEKKGAQIDALIMAQKEQLADRINQKYKYYISINGIPEDEYDEFVSLHAAYKGLGGNHHGDAKFDYCMKHLKVLPVETKLVYKTE